jgi:uncharacterized protein
MDQESREFQVFVKPVGPVCNIRCAYCYYLEKNQLYPQGSTFRMPEILLEEYIVQHIEASTEQVISFSWHGGEPMMAGLDYFMKIVENQNRHYPKNRQIVNGIQTNGTLLDEKWCSFLAEEEFVVGISMDGPKELHDKNRVKGDGTSTFEDTLKGFRLLQQHGISPEILCVVHAYNVGHPLEVYRYFRGLGAQYITFLPLVESQPGSPSGVSKQSVSAEAFGKFLCSIFDEWKDQDIGKVKVQIFEEAIRTAFGQDHTLCIFKSVCGSVPVIEHNGDFFSCDHYVNNEHLIGNILEVPLAELLDSPEQKAFGRAKLGTLPRYCLECGVRDMCGGECPKNRFIKTPSGEEGLNYLCKGYKMFFNHCRPFVKEVAKAWQQNQQSNKET